MARPTGGSLYSTFGKLDDVSEHCVVPSTLTYKERVQLSASQPYEYGRLYSTPTRVHGDVWQRLLVDASVRRSLPAKQNVHVPDSTGFRYVRNQVCAQPAKPPKGAEMLDPPVETLHPITLKTYRKKFGMDFMAAVRPHTQTTNQSLRVMGTYEEDLPMMERMQMQRLNGIKPGAFHPDVHKPGQKEKTLAAMTKHL